MELFYFGVFVNLAVSFIVASVAQKRGESSTKFFWISFFLSFIVAILVLIATPVEANQGRVSCLECGEKISREAKICRFCGADVQLQMSELLAQEAALLAANKQAEEELHSFAAEQRIASRTNQRLFVQKLGKSRITWLIIALVGLSFPLMQMLKTQQSENSTATYMTFMDELRSACTGDLESISISIENAIAIRTPNLSECGELMRQGYEDFEFGDSISEPELTITLDYMAKPIWSFSSSFDSWGEIPAGLKIPNETLWNYQVQDRFSYDKFQLEASINFGESLSVSKTAEADISSIAPQLKMVHKRLDGDYFSVLLQYQNFRVAQELIYEWPLPMEPETVKGNVFFSDAPGHVWNLVSVPKSAIGANVKIKVLIHDTVVQELEVPIL